MFRNKKVIFVHTLKVLYLPESLEIFIGEKCANGKVVGRQMAKSVVGITVSPQITLTGTTVMLR